MFTYVGPPTTFKVSIRTCLEDKRGGLIPLIFEKVLIKNQIDFETHKMTEAQSNDGEEVHFLISESLFISLSP